MKLILVRHGESEANAAGTLAGQEVDSPLTELGREQARAVAEKLPRDVDRIISSPMKRAAETATIINETLHVPLEFRDDIKEVSVGSLAVHTWDEAGQIAGDPDFRQHDLDCVYDYSPFGGESSTSSKARVKKFVDSLLAAHKDETIVVPAHGGVINAMNALFSDKKAVTPENASLHEYTL